MKHSVLKWLHHLLVLKYVMLWHSALPSQVFWHCSRLETFPGDLIRYVSPLVASHSTSAPTSHHKIVGSDIGNGATVGAALEPDVLSTTVASDIVDIVVSELVTDVLFATTVVTIDVPAEVPSVVGTVVVAASWPNRNTPTARRCGLVLLHSVLKWLHHLLLKYVMLWHCALVSHVFLHCSRFETFPGEFFR